MFVWFIWFIQSDFTPFPSPVPLSSWSPLPPFPFENFTCHPRHNVTCPKCPDCICEDVNITFPECPSCPKCPDYPNISGNTVVNATLL